MRVLVVEDEHWRREDARKTLEEAGFEVYLAQNKEEGLHLGLQGGYDAVIIDLGLDDLPNEPTRGLELIEELRRNNQEFPILIWSSFSDWEIQLNGRLAGADDYFVKSSNAKEFITTLKSMIHRKKAENNPPRCNE